MPTGVLEEIELQSQRVIAQKKQEVAQLAQYQSSLQTSIDEHNATLASLQAQKKALETSLANLKAAEASQFSKIKQAEGEANTRLNDRHATLTEQAELQAQKIQGLEARDKDLARKEKNLDSEKARIAKELTAQIAAYETLTKSLLAKL